jgi:hypothetical protein
MRVLAAMVLLALLVGCPGGPTERKVKYEVKEMTLEEKAAREARMRENVHQRDQLFRHVQQIRRPAYGR